MDNRVHHPKRSTYMVRRLALACSIVAMLLGIGATASAEPATTQPSAAAQKALESRGIINFRQDGAGCTGYVSISGEYDGSSGRIAVQLIRIEPDHQAPADPQHEGFASRQDPDWNVYEPHSDRVLLDRSYDRPQGERFEIIHFVPEDDIADYTVQITGAEQPENNWLTRVGQFHSLAGNDSCKTI